MNNTRKLLDPLYNFLKENRSFNQRFQKKELYLQLMPFETPYEKLTSMLYTTANTQSQPKIDKLGDFYSKYYSWFNNTEPEFPTLVSNLSGSMVEPTYKNLFLGLKSQPGWGPKTSALFCRNMYIAHVGYASECYYLTGTPRRLAEYDRLFLPVDAVIRDVFAPSLSIRSNYFQKINQLLHSSYTNEEIEVWDDLWFWGFFGAKTEKTGRDFNSGFNKKKYWIERFTDKSETTRNEIEQKIKEFTSIVLTLQKQNFE